MEYRTGGRLEVPPFRARSLGAGGTTIPVADLDWGPRFTGVRDVVAVDAGTGTPGDLANVRGKLAIIRNDPLTTFVDDALHAAQAAGSAAVLVSNPTRPGIEEADSAVRLNDGLTVPVLRTSRSGANELLALMESRTVTVRITGVESTPIVYDLLAPTRGKVPADPGHVARTDNTARVDEVFGAHDQGMPTIEDRVGYTPLEPPVIVSDIRVVPILPAPFNRTAYVSAAPVVWMQHVLPNHGAGSGWDITPARDYRAGTRTGIRWFVPVATSNIPDSTGSAAGVRRIEFFGQKYLAACFSPLDNGPDHEEWLSTADSTMNITRNGEQLGSIEGNCAFADAPVEAADYEISLDSRRQGQWWKYSTRVRSTWKFHSFGGEQEVMPVILADLAVPRASVNSQVKVGKPATITVGLRHQKGSAGSRFASAKLEMSYDGSTWTALPLTLTGTNRYAATVTHPVDQAGKTVHLRLDVRDENGGQSTQEVTSAYGLIG